MLCLSRKQNEDIVLKVGTRTIVIRLNRLEGSRANIGIQADEDVKILRGELVPRNDPPRRAA